ncbi:hypothetical protein EB118_10545 [bacterium]|nr:hypothetical protein [bacterium]NBX97626.1 hypothetical protein [bacterium]NDC94771.1 hypothetical protein [bacterium]NDD84557.1 hypothetical protein [bacterium]NDG30495.1 hypothetical protein [bacterium]
MKTARPKFDVDILKGALLNDGYVQRRRARNVVKDVFTLAIDDVYRELPLPQRIVVNVDNISTPNSDVLAHVDIAHPDKITVFWNKICNDPEYNTVETVMLEGLLVHELVHVSGIIRWPYAPQRGHALFDHVVDEGKANAVARDVMQQTYGEFAGEQFGVHQRVLRSEKIDTIIALEDSFNSSSTVLSVAEYRAYKYRALSDRAAYVAGGLICQQYMDQSGTDAFQMQGYRYDAFLPAYKELRDMYTCTEPDYVQGKSNQTLFYDEIANE